MKAKSNQKSPLREIDRDARVKTVVNLNPVKNPFLCIRTWNRGEFIHERQHSELL